MPADHKPVRFDLRETDSLEEKVRSIVTQAVGAGSTCWEPPGGAGEFDSERALEVADAAYAAIDALLGIGGPAYPVGRCAICGDRSDHGGLPHSWATGDGKTRADVDTLYLSEEERDAEEHAAAGGDFAFGFTGDDDEAEGSR